MKERPALGVLSVACLLFNMSLLVGTLVFESGVASAYALHAPILIYGNAGFTAANGVTGGSGTPSDPYIIEEWDISASTGVGIDIRNTDAYFVIRDSYVHSGGSYPVGISLWNVTNGEVENNTASKLWVGISLREASNNTLVNNTVDSNGDCGIQLAPSSNNNTLVNNTISTNWKGICISASDGNTLVNNTAISNTEVGIDLSASSSRNTLANNSVSNNYDGIVLSSSNNTLLNNIVDSNRQTGIFLSFSNDNTLANNVMVGDGIMMDGDQLGHWNTHDIDTSNTVNGKPVYYWKNQSGGAVPLGAGEVILANCTNIFVENENVSGGSVGILLGFSNDNSLANNTASDNYYGIHIRQSNNNTFAGNNASNNELGIVVSVSVNNTLVNNIANANFDSGIALYSSGTNTLANNTVSNNVNGITLGSSSANTIANNTASSNYWAGIYLPLSIKNSLTNNTVTDNYDGIYLHSSSRNTIANNTASHNIYGFHLDSSGNNTIANNSASSNDECGIHLAYSNGNILANNTMVNDGIMITGDQLGYWNTHDIETSNRVNGKPVYYWKNRSGGAVPLGAGEVILANSTHITIENQDVSGGSVGILLGFSSNNLLANNSANSNSWRGIHLYFSNNNALANNTASSNSKQGIYLDSSRNNTLANNSARRNSYTGIYLISSYNGTLVNNIASNNGGGGFYLSDSGSSTIVHNTASSNFPSYGIYLYSSGSSTIANNNLSNNFRGIVLENSNSSTLVNNIVSNNGGDGIYLYSSGSSTLVHNTASSNNDNGIYLSSSGNHTLANNTASSNRWRGIYLYASNSNTLVNNNASNNGIGIYLHTSSNNLVYHNNLIGNAVQAYDNRGPENSWDDGYPSGGNYWSDYTGVDRFSGPNQDQPGSDRIGDTPYIIDPDSRDRYPLMTPVAARLPDLVVTPSNISFSQPPPLQEGSSVVINATIWNLGSTSSKETTVRFYDGFPPSTQIGSDQTLDPISAGGSRNVSVTWIASPPGSHQICVVADPDNLVTESNETNNMACDPVTVLFLPTLPDLVPRSFDVTPSSPIPENAVAQLNVTVRNVGDRDAMNFAILFFDDLNGNRLPDAGENITETALPRLNGHSQIRIIEPWIAYPPGSHDICVMVDYRNRVSESNETNNVACLRIDVLFSLQLTPGHWFMSFPVAVADDDIGEVLSSIAGCYDYVRWYDPLDSLDNWKSYAPGRAYNDLARLDNTMGFWINITSTCSFTPIGTKPVSTMINLHQGWNMVGFPSFRTTYTVADLKADLGLAGVLVETFDLNATSYNLQRIKDSYVMMAGEGYWVYVPSDTTWIVGG